MRVRVGDRIATIPGGHVAEVVRVDGPNWVVVRFEDSGLETGFKGIDSDYWKKVGWTIPLTRKTTKRRKSYRSKPKHAGAKKRRTVTRLRRVRMATKRRGFGVMRHAVPTGYRGIHGYSVGGTYRNDATRLKAQLVEIRPQGASPARYVIEWLDGPRKGQKQEVSERRMAGTFTGPI